MPMSSKFCTLYWRIRMVQPSQGAGVASTLVSASVSSDSAMGVLGSEAGAGPLRGGLPAVATGGHMPASLLRANTALTRTQAAPSASRFRLLVCEVVILRFL